MLLYSAERRNLLPAVPQGVGVMLDWQAGVLTLQFEDKGKVTGQIQGGTTKAAVMKLVNEAK